MTYRIRLGEVRAPSGFIVVIDPGCAAHWTRSGEDFDKEGGFRLRAPVCGGVPADRGLSVFGEPAAEGVEEGCWRKVYVEIEPEAESASAERIGVMAAGWSRLMFADAEALADLGPRDSARGAALEPGDFRFCGFPACSGDAVFDVLAERDAQGRLVRLTIECRNQECLGKFAIVTSGVMIEGRAVACLFREEPVGDTDSGWVLTSGEGREHVDDARNVHLVRLRDVMRLHPELVELLQSPVGSAFERDAGGARFIAVEFPEFRGARE